MMNSQQNISKEEGSIQIIQSFSKKVKLIDLN